MRSHHLFSVVFLFCCADLAAQAPQKISLEDALRIGQENRLELKTQALQIELAEAANDQLRAQWRPQINGAVDLRWNTQLQSNVLPIGAFGIPGVPADATRTVQFGSPFNNSISLQAEQKIVDASRGIDRKINSNAVETQRNLLEQQQIAVRYGITEAYYGALWQQERVRLAQQALDRAQVSLDEGQVRFRDGVLLQNDLDRLALDRNNARLALDRTQQDLALALERLRHQLLLPAGTNLEPAGTLEQLQAALSPLPGARVAERPELRAEQLDEQANALKSRQQILRNRPTLSAYGNYTLLQLHDQFNPFAGGTWFPFNYLGLRAAIPIYDGKQAKLAARNFDLRCQINRFNLEKLQADFDFETEQYRTALQQAETDLAQAKQNIVLANRILETDQLRLREGVILSKDLKDSEYARQQAENNYLSAAYNWLMASLNWKRASGNL